MPSVARCSRAPRSSRCASGVEFRKRTRRRASLDYDFRQARTAMIVRISKAIARGELNASYRQARKLRESFGLSTTLQAAECDE
jgi:hypothetical protein